MKILHSLSFMVLVLLSVIFYTCFGDVGHFAELIKAFSGDVTGFLKLSSVTAFSLIECAEQCKELTQCCSLIYNQLTGLCQTHHQLIPNGVLSSLSGDNTPNYAYYSFGNCTPVDCPIELGYKIWAFPDMILCLKYGRIPLNHDNALANCSGDNAHLALIDSDSTRLHIGYILDTIGADPGDTYFDGYDVGNKNIFRTWKGDVLPWASWASNNPAHNPGEDCIMGERLDNYLTRDVHCPQSCQYVCQIDLY